MIKSLFFLTTLIMVSTVGYGQTMEEGFASPPDSTRPGVYWYWINEHVSKEGITKDLESLVKLGVGEVFIGNIYIEELPPGDVKTLSPQWLECMQFAIKEGTRLGINIGLFNSPGWGTTGGPWIKPEDAMRYLTCTQVEVSGPAQVNQFIAKPKDFFQDVVLLAFSVELKNAEKARISSIPDSRNLVDLIDESALTNTIFNNRKGEQVQIDLEYNHPVTRRGLTIIPSDQHFVMQCEVYAETGSGYTLIKTHGFDRLRLAKAMGPEPFAPLSLSLGEVVASKFRVVMKNVPANFRLCELSLSKEPVLEDYQEKLLNIMPSMATPDWHAFIWKNQEQQSSEGVIDLARVQNISQFLHGDTLKWKVPEGAWKIVRVGMTTTGTINDPAAPGAVGLEIDKMNRRSLGFHFDSYLGRVVNGMSREDLKSFRKIVADSYEAGPQNWTDGLLPVFKETYGYDPLPWMAVLTGHVVGSADQSNRFLWDLRRLVADRVASEYAGGLRALCETKGKQLWLENYGWNGFPSEFLKYGSYANGIAGEFWTNAGQNIESRLAASAAHVYGRNTVYAESYTTLEAPFEYHPGKLKRVGDKSYTDGINQHILHVTIHQPDDHKFPGISTWFGIEFNRQNTWFSHSKSWIDYQRRCSYMLQQGRPSADVCFFIGEESPRMSGWVDENLSKGYDYDFINADAIENLLTVVNGRLTLPSGVSYSLLVLPPLETMRPALLKRIKELVEQGASVLGCPVDRSPGLANYPKCDKEVQLLASQIWGTTNTATKEELTRKVGKGQVFCNVPINDVLVKTGVPEVVSFDTDAEILWKKRELDKGHIYFLTNQGKDTLHFNATFKISGFAPELWNAVDGTSRPLAVFSDDGERTTIPLRLSGGESCFIVFQKEGQAGVRPLASKNNYPEEKTIAVLTESNWDIGFYNEWTGERFEVNGQKLFDWSKSDDDRIRYFSGTATYKTEFMVYQMKWDTPVYLNFEHIQVVGSVVINGHPVEAEIWCPPYRTDITPYLRSGMNTLEVKVTNLWKNRIIGQAKHLAAGQKLYLLHNTVDSNQPLLPSGMWGEVKITCTSPE